MSETDMTCETNPFSSHDSDRYAIWDMLVLRDIDAFLAQDWDQAASDFHEDGFYGTHCHFRKNPDAWRLDFPTLKSYGDEWLIQAADTAREDFAEPLRPALFRATILRDIDVQGDLAVAHKKFDGQVLRVDATPVELQWQSLYYCRRFGDQWKITGFTGYMPISGLG